MFTDKAQLYNMAFQIHMKKTLISREKWEKNMSISLKRKSNNGKHMSKCFNSLVIKEI